MTVYTGFWRADMTHYLGRFPDLRTASEPAMIAFARDRKDELEGMWVNNCCLLYHVEVEDVVVLRSDGTEFRLSDHPKAAYWRAEFSAGEFYTFVKPDWRPE